MTETVKDGDMTSASINVIPVPAFRDNYLWLFHLDCDSRAYVVDPGDARPIVAALARHNLTLAGILITHHHPDHTGGIDPLLASGKVPVYGPAGGSVPQVTHPLKDGASITLDNQLSFQILTVPGHTLDHIAYFCAQGADPVLFCGDTLFAGGCGRLFEGTPEQMYQSLGKLSRLPDPTQVYCAHEYTLANLAFAEAVDGDNHALQERIATEQSKRQQQEPTVPSTIALEKSTNPFLRCDQKSVKTAAESHCGRLLDSPQQVLAAVREWKDNF
ncbi:MAG: hydroxyacylglutathione hydrolase [Cellvibrionaceae bacterium]